MSALRKNHCPEWPGITVRFRQEYSVKTVILDIICSKGEVVLVLKILDIGITFPSSGMRTTAAIFTVSDFGLNSEEVFTIPNTKVNNKKAEYIIANFLIFTHMN